MGVVHRNRYGSLMTIVSGAGAVVTGGGGGIGRAMARRLAADGARVVVNDLDAAAAEAVATEIGGLAAPGDAGPQQGGAGLSQAPGGLGVPGDAGTEQGVAELIQAAAGFLGEIDIYCSNAGTGGGTGPDSPDDAWQRAWEVNTMAHVRAARELLPGCLGGGGGP